MSKLWIAVVVTLAATTAWAASPAPVILAVSATSSSSQSTSVTCLLDPSCDGHWSPGALDSGVDEGVYIQFEKPITGTSIELYSPGDLDRLRVYINGKTGSINGNYSLRSSGETTRTSWVDRVAHKKPTGLGNKFTIQAGYSDGLLSEKIKSIFFKVDKFYEESKEGVTITAIRLVKGSGDIMDPILPHPVPATASATSILSPDTAYQPANLTDSRYDIAWSTDGKKNDGRGESVTFDFSKPMSISGLMVWNGYQRSDEHFKANGRVKSLQVSGSAGTPEMVSLQDTMAPQRIMLAKALSATSRVTLTIKDIIPGEKYKDLLLSELRFLDDKGTMIQPVVPFKIVTPPAIWKPLIDKSFSVILHHPMTKKEADQEHGDCCYSLSRRCDNARIRIRSNGTFVIYKGFDFSKIYDDRREAPTGVESVVMEGNWEPVGDNIRIFGRQYKTALVTSEYLTKAPTAPRSTIFQSELSLSKYGKLSPAERSKLLQFLWQKKRGPGDGQAVQWGVGLSVQNMLEDTSAKGGMYGGYDIPAANYKELAKEMDHFLSLLNPYWIHSSVLDDLFEATDTVVPCQSNLTP